MQSLVLKCLPPAPQVQEAEPEGPRGSSLVFRVNVSGYLNSGRSSLLRTVANIAENTPAIKENKITPTKYTYVVQ